MAAPSATYSSVLNAAHAGGVGYTFQGFTITSKTGPQGSIFVVIVAKSKNTWTLIYQVQADGSVGRVIQAIDQDGRIWRNNYVDGWR